MLAQILESASGLVTTPLLVAIAVALFYLFGKFFGYW